jgi:hypothetical protein
VLTTGSGALADGGGPRERSEPEELHSSWPLAERLDAVCRAIAEPGPLIRRTAVRLKRIADSIPPPPKPAGRRTISELAKPYLHAEAKERLARGGRPSPAPAPPRPPDTG